MFLAGVHVAVHNPVGFSDFVGDIGKVLLTDVIIVPITIFVSFFFSHAKFDSVF